MKLDNTGYIFKGILLVISGVLIAFFPGVISWIFYIIGAVVIIGSIGTMLGGLSSGDGSLFPAGIVGILIGALIMYLPKIIMVQIPLIAGIVLAFIAITQLIKAAGSKIPEGQKLPHIILGIIVLLGSLFLIFNPFKASALVRVIIGIVMLLLAAFNFYVAYTISQRNKNSQPDIIDVSFRENDDDLKRLK